MKRKSKSKKSLLNNIKKKLKGFTLVELLAVIVILAIIMIIAIPSILSTTKSARQKSFVEYVGKMRTLGEQTYLSDQLDGKTLDTCTVYDIEKDLDLDDSGDYHGYVVAIKENNEVKYYVTLYDENYMVYGVSYNDKFTTTSLLDYTSESSSSLTKANLAKIAGCTTYTDVTSGTSDNKAEGPGVSSQVLTGLSADSVYKKLYLGAYVNYYPNETSYTPDINLTGCASYSSCAQTALNPSELTSWRVLKKNDDGTIDLVSTYSSTNTILIYGKTGFINYDNELNKACEAYINPTYASKARSIGYDGQTLVLSNLDALKATTTPWSESTVDNSHESECGGDTLYLTDNTLMKSAGILYKTKDVGGTKANYWTASRNYYLGEEYWSFSGSFINVAGDQRTGNFCRFYYYRNDNKSFERANAYAIRPVVTIKANVEIASGSGSSSSPYELTV